MIFFIYSIIYFLSLFIAIWLALFLLKNRDGSSLHRYMILSSLTAFTWFIADFFTFIDFTNIELKTAIWRLGFFVSWSLVVAVSLLIWAYVGKINNLVKIILILLYLPFAYIILFTDLIILRADPLVFAGDSSYAMGYYFAYLGLSMVILLVINFYLILREYFRSTNIQKKINGIIFLAVFLVVFFPTISNLILPFFSVAFPRLAVLSVSGFLLAFVYLIHKYKAFGIKTRIFDINTKISIAIILVSLIPILLISWGFYQDARSILQEQELLIERSEIVVKKTAIEAFLHSTRQDLLFLINSSNFRDFINSNLEENGDEYEGRTSHDFAEFSRSRGTYHQIRYLDETGQEIIRIDNVDGVVQEISDDKLQNKADRYYFYESIDLDAGIIYVSLLDLNIENNKIEIPYNPMIRYATPVFDDLGNKKGVVILNVKAKGIVDSVRETDSLFKGMYMLNSEGYYLVNPNRDKEWGFMLNADDNIFKDENLIAEKIFQAQDYFQFPCPDDSCYITGQKIYFSEDKNLNIIGVEDALSPTKTEFEEKYWIIYSKIDQEILFSVLNKTLYDIYVLILLIFIILVLISLFLSRFLVKPIYKLKKGIDIITKGDFGYRVKIEIDDEIGDLSIAFNQMAGAIEDSRREVDKKVKYQTQEIIKKSKELEDQQEAILNVLEDVEEEKEKTTSLAKDLEKFKLAVENAYNHIVITDQDGICLYANEAVERITGFPRKEILGKKVGTKENWGGLMSKEFYSKLWRTIKVDKQTFAGEAKNKRKNGQIYDTLANISPILNEKGQVKFFVAIERDISKEKEIDRAKSEFVSLASHQLRTPLSTINWYTEMLLAEDAGKLNNEQKEYLEEVYKGNQRMVDLVNALLNVSRIEMGTLAIEPELTNLVDLAESVLNEAKPQIITRKQKVIKNFSKDIPSINLDSKLMRIVFQNYVSNAIKYTREKGQIEVGIKKKKTEVLISVKDNGMGIPKYQQEKIFTKLFRADNVREKETDGTGLGLYIVKSVIEQFGGKVWFESVENKGATFYATVPLKGVKAKEGSKGLENTK